VVTDLAEHFACGRAQAKPGRSFQANFWFGTNRINRVPKTHYAVDIQLRHVVRYKIIFVCESMAFYASFSGGDLCKAQSFLSCIDVDCQMEIQ